MTSSNKYSRRAVLAGLGASAAMLPLLHADDLKNVAKSRNVPSALATAARKLAATREAK